MKAKMDNIFSYEVDPLIGVKVLLDLFKYLEKFPKITLQTQRFVV